jgi:predicted enzyme related to lactoylglutathione lyase
VNVSIRKGARSRGKERLMAGSQAKAGSALKSEVGSLVEVDVPTGGVVWSEYAATDVNVAKAFYSQLFGWETRTKHFGKEGAYTTFFLRQGQRLFDVAGLLCLSDLDGAGDRGCWMPVMKVHSVDAVTARSCELGASMLAPPAGFSGLDRHSILAGPSGIRYALFDAREGRVCRGPCCVRWSELRATDPAKTALFAWQAFGWQAESVRDHDWSLRVTFRHEGHNILSMCKGSAGDISRCLPCIEVIDLDARVLKAVALGATVLEQRDSDPIHGRCARISDPLGEPLMLVAS